MAADNGQTRREELLTVATKLFAARGYHGTRMDDVADVVGLNKATVYHYYASKSLILFDIYQRAAERTLAAVHDDPSWTAREALYQYTVRLLTQIASNPEGAAVYFQEQPYITEWFTEEQVVHALRQAEAGTPTVEVCRKLGVSEQTFYRWKAKYSGMSVSDAQKLKTLEDENRRLKRMFADLSMQADLLREALGKK